MDRKKKRGDSSFFGRGNSNIDASSSSANIKVRSHSLFGSKPSRLTRLRLAANSERPSNNNFSRQNSNEDPVSSFGQVSLFDDSSGNAVADNRSTISLGSINTSDFLKSTKESSMPFATAPTTSLRSSSITSGSYNSRRNMFVNFEEDASSELVGPLRDSRTAENQAKYKNFFADNLRLDRLPFFGRKEEQGVLTSALDRIYSKAGSRELIVIKGTSGSGKTSLALTVKKQIKARKGGAFVMSRFHPQEIGQTPYKTFSDVCSRICQVLHASKSKSPKAKELVRSVQDQLLHQLSTSPTQMVLLMDLVPELKLLLEDRQKIGDMGQADSKKDSPSVSGSSNISVSSEQQQKAECHLFGYGQQQQKFLYAFQTFFQITNAAIDPLCVVLDDLQFADAASIQLLENIIYDLRNRNLFLICLYREGEDKREEAIQRHSHASSDSDSTVGALQFSDAETNQSSSDNNSKHSTASILPEQERLYVKLLETTKETKESLGNLQMSHLTTKGLSIPTIHQMFIEVFNYDSQKDAELLPLAKLCHRRTLGNAFNVMTFLRQLRDDNLLKFDIASNRWTWDMHELTEQTFAMRNAVDVMTEKMKRLPKHIQYRLAVAACIGVSFPEDILTLALQHDDEAKGAGGKYQQEEQFDDDNWLAQAIEYGFLEKMESSTHVTRVYQWVHDSVRKGALTLVTPNELCEMKGKLGRQLYLSLAEDELQSIVFVVANLIHDGPSVTDEEERIRYARVNLEAAQRAVAISAFHTSAKYAQRGIKLLPDDRWATHNDLAAQLYRVAAQTEDMIGLTDMVKVRYEEVTSQENVPPDVLMDVNCAQFRALSQEFKHEEAAELVISMLEERGIRFPKTNIGRTFAVITQLMVLTKKLKKLKFEDMDDHPDMDYSQLTNLKLIHQLGTYSYGTPKHQLLLPLTFIKSYYYTMEHGVSMLTPPAFGAFGLIYTGILKNYKLGGKMGLFAMKLLESRQYQSTAANTIFNVNQFTRPWLDPISSILQEFLRGYEAGLLYGDIEFSSWNIQGYLVACFQAGRNLKQLERDCRNYCAQLRHYNSEQALGGTISFWLTYVHLIGDEKDTKPLNGEVEATMTLEEFGKERSEIPHNHLQCLHLRSRLCLWFGDHKEGARLAIERGDRYEKELPAFHAIMPETFARGVSLYAMAIRTRKAVYKRHAKKVHKTIKTWRKAGNPNVIGYEKHLDAERAVLKGQFATAESIYHSAKVIARRSGLVHDAALAAERCGEMLLDQQKMYDARTFIEEAISLYEEWGATAKVKQLREKHFTFWLS